MTRFGAIVAALAALLVFAPAALAASFVVNDSGDAPDATPGDGVCETVTGNGVCTLRAAIQEADATPNNPIDVPDTITFTGAGQAPSPLTGLNATTSAAITDPVTLDGGGATTVTFDAAAAGPLLESTAASVTLEGIKFTGGTSGPVLLGSGTAMKLDHVTVDTTPGTAIQLSGTGAQLTSVTVNKPGGHGIRLDGASPSVTNVVVNGAGGNGVEIGGSGGSVLNSTVAGSAGDGVHITGSSTKIQGGTVRGNGSSGISISGNNDVVAHVVIYGNGTLPIFVATGANGGIHAPADLRIGPRRADGSLPLTGTTGGGTIELFAGNPFGPLAPSFLDAFSVPQGGFTHLFATEPPPGATFAADVTNNGTSEFSTVAVPADITSPDLARARALSTTDVRITPTEPLDPASVQASDFTLTMAGQDRAITAVTPAPDGSYVTLTSSGWKPGEAGYVQLTAPGAVTDIAGNANLNTTRFRVAAAPGDFIAPIAGQFSLSPQTMCLTFGRNCRHTGTTITFVTSEAGKATLVVQRGDKRIGTRVYNAVGAGLNRLKFNGRLAGRKLRAGRYRVLLYVQDLVGNVTDQPPIALLSVRRVSG